MTNPEKYVCDACLGEFDKKWSDEEAIAEKNALWPSTPLEDYSIICDDCFKEMIGEQHD